MNRIETFLRPKRIARAENAPPPPAPRPLPVSKPRAFGWATNPTPPPSAHRPDLDRLRGVLQEEGVYGQDCERCGHPVVEGRSLCQTCLTIVWECKACGNLDRVGDPLCRACSDRAGRVRKRSGRPSRWRPGVTWVPLMIFTVGGAATAVAIIAARCAS